MVCKIVFILWMYIAASDHEHVQHATEKQKNRKMTVLTWLTVMFPIVMPDVIIMWTHTILHSNTFFRFSKLCLWPWWRMMYGAVSFKWNDRICTQHLRIVCVGSIDLIPVQIPIPAWGNHHEKEVAHIPAELNHALVLKLMQQFDCISTSFQMSSCYSMSLRLDGRYPLLVSELVDSNTLSIPPYFMPVTCPPGLDMVTWTYPLSITTCNNRRTNTSIRFPKGLQWIAIALHFAGNRWIILSELLTNLQ